MFVLNNKVILYFQKVLEKQLPVNIRIITHEYKLSYLSTFILKYQAPKTSRESMNNISFYSEKKGN